MSQKLEDTKKLTKYNTEEFDELLEYDKIIRNKKENSKKGVSSMKKRCKKNKKAVLSVIATLLGFVLVFVIFFAGAYVFFTINSGTQEVVSESSDAPVSEQVDLGANANKEDFDFEDENLPPPALEEEKDAEEDKETAPEKEEVNEDDKEETTRPASKPQTSTVKEEKPKPQQKPGKNEEKVDNNENSEAIVLE